MRTTPSPRKRRPAEGPSFRVQPILFPSLLLLMLFGCADVGDKPEPVDVAPPVASLLSPVGGETWLVGEVHRIQWNAGDPDTPQSALRIDLEFFADGVAPVQIASGWPNNGEYEWTVPNVPTQSARIRLRVSDGHRSSTVSSTGAFTILEPPDPGSNLLAVGSASGRAGESADVAMSLVNESEVAALITHIEFDPAVVGFTSATLVERGAGRLLTATEEATGEFILELTPGDAIEPIAPGSGAIIRLTFALLAPGGSSTDLMLHETALRDSKDRLLNVTVSTGAIVVGAAGTPAVLARLLPARTVAGDTVRVVGSELGDEPGEVRFTASSGEATATVVSWSASEARVLVPNLAVDGPVKVRKGTTDSNGLAFSVAPRLISFRQDLSAPGKPLQHGGCQSCHFCAGGVGGSGGFCLIESGNQLDVQEVLTSGDHGPNVIPRDSANSNLVRKLLPSPPFGDRMPQGGALRADEIQLIQDWIDQGARDN
ncbi:MAG: hypothetical protein U0527_05195 [Candidatus Eisenbacteria bacterium]